MLLPFLKPRLNMKEVEDVFRDVEFSFSASRLGFNSTTSAATVTSVVRHGSNLTIANLGTGRALLGSVDPQTGKFEVRALTQDHSNASDQEIQRIQGATGATLVRMDPGAPVYVQEPYCGQRLSPALIVTRGFGSDAGKEGGAFSSEPHLTTVALRPEIDQYLILASSAVLTSLGNAEIGTMCHQGAGRGLDPAQIASRIATEALTRWDMLSGGKAGACGCIVFFVGSATAGRARASAGAGAAAPCSPAGDPHVDRLRHGDSMKSASSNDRKRVSFLGGPQQDSEGLRSVREFSSGLDSPSLSTPAVNRCSAGVGGIPGGGGGGGAVPSRSRGGGGVGGRRLSSAESVVEKTQRGILGWIKGLTQGKDKGSKKKPATATRQSAQEPVVVKRQPSAFQEDPSVNARNLAEYIEVTRGSSKSGLQNPSVRGGPAMGRLQGGGAAPRTSAGVSSTSGGQSAPHSGNGRPAHRISRGADSLQFYRVERSQPSGSGASGSASRRQSGTAGGAGPGPGAVRKGSLGAAGIMPSHLRRVSRRASAQGTWAREACWSAFGS